MSTRSRKKFCWGVSELKVCVELILECILEKQDVRMRIVFISLRTGANAIFV
jgi:hypothetical protein